MTCCEGIKLLLSQIFTCNAKAGGCLPGSRLQWNSLRLMCYLEASDLMEGLWETDGIMCIFPVVQTHFSGTEIKQLNFVPRFDRQQW